jgi:hypothetical protein
MGFTRLAGRWGAFVLCFLLFGGGTIEAQNKSAAPSITVYQDPG